MKLEIHLIGLLLVNLLLCLKITLILNYIQKLSNTVIENIEEFTLQ